MQWADFFTRMFDHSFASRWSGTCTGWTKELALSHVIVDMLIWASYMVIPILLIKLIIKRKDLPFNVFFFLFAIFIVGCGFTHLLGAITTFIPYYYLDFWIKSITAIASVGTAGYLWKSCPIMVNLPNPFIEKAKRETEFRFKQMANNIRQLAWMAEPNGYLYWYNERWFDYTGTNLEQMKGWGWQTVHDPLILPAVMEEWNNSIANGVPFEMTFPLKGKDGIFRPFLTTVMPLFDENKKLIHWFGTNTDITEQKQTEKELRDLIVVNKELENFALVAAHDLQDPLKQNSVLLKMIQQGRHEFMPEVSKNNARMQSFIKNLLIFARSGGATVKPEPAELKTILDNVKNDLSVIIAECNAKITIDNLPTIKCDAMQIGRVLQNLMKNAIKCRCPDRQLEINISVKLKKDYWTFVVEDNGIGIPENMIPTLFTIYGGKKNDSTGAGFGLAICKRIIESHDGSITVKSKEGVGTTFTFTIKVI